MTPDWSALGWFALVVVAIPLALWMFRRSGAGARMAAASMKAVGALPLSASQKLVTVEVGQGDERRWLVLGVTPGSINLLYTLSPHDDPSAAPSPVTPAEGFAQLLSRLKTEKRDGAGDDGR
ncbi:MAG: flagellar biosynthetic protein FliO [Rubrivivax sp.]|jgi:flagellar protein FliO/FliZ|nr:flagellar biosynthetic protein FliO [Rubrivivax sp.]